MDSAMKKEKGPPRLALNDHRAVRRTLARLMRMRFAGTMGTEVFRDLCYAANIILAFDRHAADLRIEDRLVALEAQLAAKEATR